MKKLTQIFRDFETLLLEVTGEVYHYWHDAQELNCYIVWQESSGDQSEWTDNRNTSQQLRIDVELYVLDPLDSTIDDLQEAFDSHCLSWQYMGSSYETETGLVHHSWEVVYG